MKEEIYGAVAPLKILNHFMNSSSNLKAVGVKKFLAMSSNGLFLFSIFI